MFRRIFFALALVAAIVVAFSFGVGAIKGTLRDAFATERAIGEAHRYADLAIRLQLDEETAVRGYVGSGRRIFLEPYRRATREFDPTLDALEVALVRTHLADERTFVAQARATNRRWLTLVAGPLLADRRRPDAQFLGVRGKTLFDRYLAAIGHVDRALVARAAVETTAAALAVSRVGFLGVLAVVLVALVLAFSLRTQSRLGRELLDERRVAAAMQRGLLQSSLPKLASLAFDASYVPAGREALVGGDWYDVHVLAGERVMFSIGDVAGHGVDAAIVMSRAREAIVALGFHATDPADVLARVNDVLLLQNSQLATAIFGYVDSRTRTVTYASAGHPPPLLASPGAQPYFLPYGGSPLAMLRDQTFTNQRFVAPPGSALILYTDGFTERTRDMLEGERVLIAAAAEAAHAGFTDYATRIHRRIFGDAAPNDDAAIVTIAFVDAAGPDDDERETAARGTHATGRGAQAGR
ncbi:MAG: hypothetical protein NVSMB19_25740 [Vulcanimicrobiaceae bacterium]